MRTLRAPSTRFESRRFAHVGTLHSLSIRSGRCKIESLSERVRGFVEQQTAGPIIPLKLNRRWQRCFNKTLYKNHGAIKRMRYRKASRVLAANLLGNIHPAVMWWWGFALITGLYCQADGVSAGPHPE